MSSFFRTFKDIFQAFCQTSIRSCADKLEMCSSEDPLSTGLPFKLTDSGALLHIDSSNCFIFVKALFCAGAALWSRNRKIHIPTLPDISRSNRTAQSHCMSWLNATWDSDSNLKENTWMFSWLESWGPSRLRLCEWKKISAINDGQNCHQ